MDRLLAFPHLLATNSTPRSIEVAAVKSELKRIDKHIPAVLQQLWDLHEAREKCLAILSPLRRVPADVLAEIFVFAVASLPPAEYRGHLLDICLVCKLWRQVAVSTHQLWTSLDIDMPLTRAGFQRAKTWLARSGALPKTLSIAAPDDYCRFNKPCHLASRRLRKLLTQGPVIDSLAISCPTSICVKKFYALLRRAQQASHLDSLKSLDLTFREGWYEYEEGAGLPIFSNLPMVTTLCFHLPFLPNGRDDMRALKLPSALLSNLTTFTLDSDWVWNKLLRVLQACQNIDKLTLDFKTSYLRIEEDTWIENLRRGGGIVFPKLRTLRLQHMEQEEFERIHSFFKAPALEELDISLECDAEPHLNLGETRFDDHLASFIDAGCQRCNDPILRCLRFHRLRIPASYLLSVLARGKLGKSLSHLTFDDVRTNYFSFFRGLASHSEWLPNLSLLEIINCSADFYAGDGQAFLQTRQISLSNSGSQFTPVSYTIAKRQHYSDSDDSSDSDFD